MNATNTLIGVWDARNAPLRLGSFCIFLQELLIQKAESLPSYVTVHIVSEHDTLLTNITKSIAEIDDVVLYSTPQVIKNALCFPQEPYKIEQNYFDTTLRIQQYVKNGALIAYLNFTHATKVKVKHILQSSPKYNDSKPTIALHLKNVQGETREASNADMAVWFDFLQSPYAKKFNCVFIGNDVVSKDILSLPNALSFNALTFDFVLHLCMIRQADMFMGMSSGPSSIAVLSEKPYLIFKHPKHHTEHMFKEIGTNNAFPFALKNQCFLREEESVNTIQDFVRKL